MVCTAHACILCYVHCVVRTSYIATFSEHMDTKIFGNFVSFTDLKLKIFAPVNGTDMHGPYQQFFNVEQKKNRFKMYMC